MGRRKTLLRRIRNFLKSRPWTALVYWWMNVSTNQQEQLRLFTKNGLCSSCKSVKDTVEDLPADFNTTIAEDIYIVQPEIPQTEYFQRPAFAPMQSLKQVTPVVFENNFSLLLGAVPDSAEDLTEIEIKKFYQLLEDNAIKQMLEADRDAKIADKYLLATVLIYFKRAGLVLNEYTQMNFFAALSLAHEILEDTNDANDLITLLALGENWKINIQNFFRLKDELLEKLEGRALVSKTTCEEVMFQNTFLQCAWRRCRKSDDIKNINWNDFLPWF